MSLIIIIYTNNTLNIVNDRTLCVCVLNKILIKNIFIVTNERVNLKFLNIYVIKKSV